jgi:hypothetical protein
MSQREEGSVQFSPADFRTWNEAGFEEVSAALLEARRRFTEAGSLREQALAQLRLDSLEQLYKLALEVARGRFERARADAAGRLRVVVEKLQAATTLPVVKADQFWQKVSAASQAFAAKRFDEAIRELAGAEAEIALKPLRLQARAPVLVAAKPAGSGIAGQQAPANNNLLGLAAQHEQSGRRGVACRLYLRAIVQSASAADRS